MKVSIRNIGIYFNSRKKPGYGYYGIKPYILSLSFLFIFGVGNIILDFKLDYSLLNYFGASFIIYGFVSTAGWLLMRYIIPGAPAMFARKIVSSLAFEGNENVIDIGTGRGLYAIEVAKILKCGKVVGIDVWDPERIPNLKYYHKWAQPTRNTIENARQNAILEKVGGKVQFLNMDANSLQFNSNTFDLAICGYVLGHLGNHSKYVLREIYRTLKPGGQLIIIDHISDLGFFFLSTPHLFLFSYVRGKKAKNLTKNYWLKLIEKTGLQLSSFQKIKGIMVLKALKSVA